MVPPRIVPDSGIIIVIVQTFLKKTRFAKDRSLSMRAASAIVHVLVWVSLSLFTGWELRNALPDRREALARAGITLLEGMVFSSVGSHRSALDVYLPTKGGQGTTATTSRRRAVLAIHGGSWCGGSITDYRSDDPNNTIFRLARQGLVVVAIDYRLTRPGSPSWPGVIDDLREAVRWIRRHASEFEIDPERIVAMGQSSGAHLAALLGALPEDLGNAGVSSRVQAVVSFYGPTDLMRSMRTRHLDYEPTRFLFGNDHAAIPETKFAASPINHVTYDDAPMLLLHGSDDQWVLPEQSERMAKALESAGVPHRLVLVDGARHGFEAMVNYPVKRDLLPEILAFLESVWNVSIGGTRPDSRESP
jgi:acetyl esterase/lipase